MAQVTEKLVWSSDVSNTGVTNPGNTISSNDSRNAMDSSLDWTFELTNLSQTPTSIVSIKPYIEGRTDRNAGTHVFFHKILNGSGTELYSEAASIADDEDGSVTSYSTRTTSDGSSAWTENDINTLRIRLDQIAFLGSATEGQIDHYYIEVVYNVPDPTAGRIFITSGAVALHRGMVKMEKLT